MMHVPDLLLNYRLGWFNVSLLIGVAVTVLESFKKKIRGLISVVAVGHKTLSHPNLQVNPVHAS